jgi:hypothetical protein
MVHKKIALIIATYDFSDGENYGMDSIIKNFIIPNEQKYQIDVYIVCSVSEDLNKVDHILGDRIKGKFLDMEKQLSKFCNTLTKIPKIYMWYVKYRPNIIFNQLFLVDTCNIKMINCRVREYTGPRKIEFAGSAPLHVKDAYHFSEKETHVIMDDMFYILGYKCVTEYINTEKNPDIRQDECYHTDILTRKGTKINPLSIDITFQKDKNGDKAFWRSTNVNI